ncbi:MAG: hypothetical protein QXO86_04785, partial [Nitrososphaerota archaeon]
MPQNGYEYHSTGLHTIRILLRGNFLVMLIGYCIAVPLIGTTIAYLPLYLDGLGATPLIIGLAIGFPEFIALILRIPGGYIGDAYGRKYLTVRMNFVLGIVGVFIAFS